jgi:hypothetical protein
MLQRNIELYYQLKLDDTGTKILDLKTTDPISGLRLDFEATNGGTSNKSNFINDIVTKVEIVDGSDQLLSLNLKQAQALQWYQTNVPPYIRPGELNSGNQNEHGLFLFGRFLWDPEYYLDLKKFNNPQLKITTDEDAVRAMGATGFLSGSFKVTINLHVIEEGASEPKGFFMNKEFYSFTSGTSGDEHVDLPRDYPYSRLILRAHKAGNDVDENISNLKISCDAGKFIPIDKKVKKLYQANEEDYGPMSIRYYLYRKNGEAITHIINHDPVVSLEPWAAKRITGALNSWSGGLTLYLYTDAGAAVDSEEMIGMVVTGSCPHSTIDIPFGLIAEPATFFDPKKFEDIDLILTQAAAANVQVVSQQLRSYE